MLSLEDQAKQLFAPLDKLQESGADIKDIYKHLEELLLYKAFVKDKGLEAEFKARVHEVEKELAQRSETRVN